MHVWCHQNGRLCELRPSFSSEKLFSLYVSDLLGGVHIFDLDARIQVYPIKQPIQIHTMSSGDMSHGRAPSFYDHLDHRIIVFKKINKYALIAGDV